LDLLQRIQHYDDQNAGANLRISPVVQEMRDQMGRSTYVDTGNREVAVDSQQGSEQVALILGGPNTRYGSRDDLRNIDPLAAIASLFVGQLLNNGRFNQWNHMPRRHDFWQDRRGQMWYPEGGSWRHQGMGPSQHYQGIPGQFSQRRFFPDRQDNGPPFGSAEWHRRQQSHNWRDQIAPEGSDGWRRMQQFKREQAIREQREREQREKPGTPEWWEQKKRNHPAFGPGNPAEWQRRHQQPPQDGPRREVPRQGIPPQGTPPRQEEMPRRNEHRPEGPRHHVPRQEVPRQEVPRQEIPRQQIPRQEVPRQRQEPRQEQQRPIQREQRNPHHREQQQQQHQQHQQQRGDRRQGR